ncbi:hypothetical protein AXW37_07645 [Yersinia ruckeri]|nr:membrane protein [Yersinia ruckeri]EEP98519.1 hypothetical protein yruck0001_11770 [Yersinia ruckeri ATCC 29473]OEU25255.1 hypothetical protein BI323_02855 [Yersinia ruckeri]OIX31093.1 hypothetical protein AXW19_06970 [Yersinia ruckeri]OIX31232.1 hypothetical protein AXW20_06980 [Yersinia ruckeri]
MKKEAEMDITLQAVAIGIGATLIMDIWAILQKRLLNIPSLDYRLVGRWLGHMSRGQFVHHTILQANAVRGEVLVGWLAHYAIGIIFSFLLITATGPGWLVEPTFLPALIVGIISIVAPFFIMQPGFGFGIAASRLPQPNVARRRSLIAHTSFGVGLYISAQVLRFMLN